MNEILFQYQIDTISSVLEEREMEKMQFINNSVGFALKTYYFLRSRRYEDTSALRAFMEECDESMIEYLGIISEIKIKIEELENYFPDE